MTQYNILASTDECTVVSEYKPEGNVLNFIKVRQIRERLYKTTGIPGI